MNITITTNMPEKRANAERCANLMNEIIGSSDFWLGNNTLIWMARGCANYNRLIALVILWQSAGNSRGYAGFRTTGDKAFYFSFPLSDNPTVFDDLEEFLNKILADGISNVKVQID